MSRFLIYALADPHTGEVRYIGQSSKGMERPKEHWRPSKICETNYKARWLRKVVASGKKPIIQVLETFSNPDLLDQAESRWIETGLRLGWPLTNYRLGAHTARGHKLSEETKAKISAAHTGMKATEETRAILRKRKPAMLGRKHSPETIAKMSARKLGKRVSDEARAKISKTLLERNAKLRQK